MSDYRKVLLEKFKPANLYSNFGAALTSMSINGFRGINNLKIDFEYPITAISGFNGTGKSTIGQLAVCAYKKPVTAIAIKRHYVKEFFPVSQLDPNPFDPNANVKYQYATNTNVPQDLTVSRKPTEWSGYKRQPERHCYYVGFALYIPKIERKDLSVYKPGSFTIGTKRVIDSKIKTAVSSILNNNYTEVAFQSINHLKKGLELGLVTRRGAVYSENNMGFGEGRLLYMIDLLETAPDNSLFILEEPETSLHEDAQYKFTKYLMEICNRKGHQIIMSTHSSIILDCLPPEGRKFLIRTSSDVKILDRISANHAKSLLADGQNKALSICVEDRFAQLLLTEVIRIKRPDILPTLLLQYVGDTKAVANTVATLNIFGKKAIGVRDADKGEDVAKKLFSLPGKLPPEKEVYENVEVQNKLNKKYNINIADILAGQGNVDHHSYGKLFSEKAYCSEEAMNLSAIQFYIETLGIDQFDSLLNKIIEEL